LVYFLQVGSMPDEGVCFGLSATSEVEPDGDVTCVLPASELQDTTTIAKKRNSNCCFIILLLEGFG
jgi:hypothetical protein